MSSIGLLYSENNIEAYNIDEKRFKERFDILMKKEIVNILKQVEKDNNVKILYAVESGSRGWGFPSKDSDYDARFIYINKENFYLSIFDKKDFIELPVDEVLDINGWNLKKTLKLLFKSNPPLLEWLSSPIVYMKDETFIKEFRNIAKQYFSPIPVMYHYINLAKKTFSSLENMEKVKVKKLFYVIRPVMACKWVEEKYTIPPMKLQDMMKEVVIDINIQKLINGLIDLKADCIESDTIKPDETLINYLDKQINYYDNYVKSIKHNKNRSSKVLDEFFQKSIKNYGGQI